MPLECTLTMYQFKIKTENSCENFTRVGKMSIPTKFVLDIKKCIIIQRTNNRAYTIQTQVIKTKIIVMVLKKSNVENNRVIKAKKKKQTRQIASYLFNPCKSASEKKNFSLLRIKMLGETMIIQRCLARVTGDYYYKNIFAIYSTKYRII